MLDKYTIDGYTFTMRRMTFRKMNELGQKISDGDVSNDDLMAIVQSCVDPDGAAIDPQDAEFQVVFGLFKQWAGDVERMLS